MQFCANCKLYKRKGRKKLHTIRHFVCNKWSRLAVDGKIWPFLRLFGLKLSCNWP